MDSKGDFAYLHAKTTIRLEALKYVSGLYSDRNGGVSSSGWKLILGKEFDGKISSSEIASFVDEVNSYCMEKEEGFKEFDKARVCALLFTNFRCTVNESNIGFILKSKTVMERRATDDKQKKQFFLFRPFSWSWRVFKRMYNGFLEMLKIG